MFGSTSYMRKAHDPKRLRHLVDAVVGAVMGLREKEHFDVIAFRGMSGASVAYPVSFCTGIPLVNVRKNPENSHGCPIEGPPGDYEIKRYLILDDLIESGETVRAVARSLKEGGVPYSGCVGVLLYDCPHWGDVDVASYPEQHRVPVHYVEVH